ncbi:MAG: glycoside hydrolase family 28 protein, partial [Verrucomicrobiota bacterium]
MKHQLHLLAVIALACAGLSCAGVAPKYKVTSETILARIKAPTFPARDFPITAYGARPGADCTDAIHQAIAACHQAGGGRVVVPAGEWLTGAVRLQSNVNLHVAEGATLRWTFDLEKYPVVFTRWEGIECMNYSPFIYAF